MKKYIINYAESRGFDKYEIERQKCEVCGINYIQEIHHIECSMRGKRSDDPTKLIGVCCNCHIRIHAHNNFETRQNLLKIVEGILYFK